MVIKRPDWVLGAIIPYIIVFNGVFFDFVELLARRRSQKISQTHYRQAILGQAPRPDFTSLGSAKSGRLRFDHQCKQWKKHLPVSVALSIIQR